MPSKTKALILFNTGKEHISEHVSADYVIQRNATTCRVETAYF
jgi:hypothetical protein